MKKGFLVIVIFFFSCCRHQATSVSKGEINNFIVRYRNVEFPEFKNTFIFVRQRTLTSTIYVIHKDDRNLPVYFVTFNELTNRITEISNKLLQEQKMADYFTDSQIITLINKFRTFNFELLGVDVQRNVYINPFYSNRPAFFFRKGRTAKLNITKLAGDYVQYEDNWYIDRKQLSVK